MARAEPQTADPEVILMQIMSAIGQGAGTVRVGYEATAVMRARYLVPVQTYVQAEGATRWATDRAVTLEWARVVGRKAASLAAASSSFEIMAEHMTAALDEAFYARSVDGPCPLTPRDIGQ